MRFRLESLFGGILVMLSFVSIGRCDLTSWGTFVDATSNDENSDDFFGSDGGRLIRESTIESPNSDLVFASAALERSGHLALPTLRGELRNAATTTSAFATATAIEGYAYEGSTTEEFTLTANLSGFIVGNASVGAQFAVFTDDYEFDTSNTFEYTYFDDTFAAQVYLPDFTSASITFTVNPGDRFYVAAQLYLNTHEPNSIASSLNTLETEISATNSGVENLSSASIPEPSAVVALFLCFSILPLGVRRR